MRLAILHTACVYFLVISSSCIYTDYNPASTASAAAATADEGRGRCVADSRKRGDRRRRHYVPAASQTAAHQTGEDRHETSSGPVQRDRVPYTGAVFVEGLFSI